MRCLDPDRNAIGRHRAQLERTYRTVDKLLNTYQPISSEEREQFAHLREAVDVYQRTTVEPMTSDRSEWLAEARSLLRASA
jgi:hypothetical protein